LGEGRDATNGQDLSARKTKRIKEFTADAYDQSPVDNLNRKIMRLIRAFNMKAKSSESKCFDSSKRTTPDSIVTVRQFNQL